MMEPEPRFCSACGARLGVAAKFCAQCGVAVATAMPSAPPISSDAERRQATVLFADLCGYTALSRRLDAEEVRATLERFFAATDDVVRRHGGTVDKHVGDAVMAVFGAPVSHGNDAERAVRAALAMHAAVAALETPDGQRLAIHVGIANGEVVAGRTGSALHAAYTVTGEAANLAARLVERAGPGETVLAAGVHAAASRVAKLAPLGDVELKGFAAPQPLWRVDAATPTPVVPDLPLAGRAAERAQLAAVLDAAIAGTGQLVLLRGEPGIGKSRLVAEALDVAQARSMHGVRAQVLDFGVERGADAAGTIARALLAGAPQLEADHVAALDDLLGRERDAAGASIWNAMSPTAREHARQRAVTALATNAAAHAPLLIAVEDLHWAEPGLLAILAALAATARGQRIALLLTTRLDGDPIDRAWRAKAGAIPFTAIELAPLSDAEAMRLAQAIRPEAGDGARDWITRAEGNPLFLIELARHAAESRTALPDTVQSVVQSRLDRLKPADKALVQCASIAGQRVDAELLAAVTGESTIDAARLIEAGLLRPEGTGFVFAHALVLEGVYGTLLRARRRELHRRAAAHYAARDLAVAAGHLERAEDPGAPEAYRRAAEDAFAQGRVAESLGLAERGLRIAQAIADRAALGFARGEALLELGQGNEAEATFRAILDVAATAEARCHAWNGIAASQRLLSRIDDAFASLMRADEARGGDGALALSAARTHYLRGNLHFARGEVERCRVEHEAALEVARAAGSIEYEVRALNGLGDAAYGAGRMRTALAAFERCSELCRTHGMARVEQTCAMMIGVILRYFNEHARSMSVLTSAIETGERTANHLGVMIMTLAVIGNYEQLGRDDEALVATEHALSLSRSLGARRFEVPLLIAKAGNIWRRGDLASARNFAEEAVTVARDTGFGFYGAGALGRLALVVGDDDAARAALAEGEAEIARGCLAHNYTGFFPDAIAVSRHAGRLDEALRYADALEAHFAAEPLPLITLLCRRARALVAVAQGRRDGALRHELTELRDEVLRAGLVPMLAELEEAIAAFG